MNLLLTHVQKIIWGNQMVCLGHCNWSVPRRINELAVGGEYKKKWGIYGLNQIVNG